MLSPEDLSNNSSAESCWILVNGTVWDLTDFAPVHPGGAQVIHKYAGRDASAAYNSVHAPSLLKETLDISKRKGTLDTNSILADSRILQTPDMPTSNPAPLLEGSRPPLTTLKNSYDFEEVASRMLSKKAWAFYSSAATDLITKDGNKTMFDRIWIRPRILRDVKTVDTKTSMLGCSVELPLFISPAAMAKMAHPEGELAMAKACGKYGVAQCISTNASFPMSEITACAPNIPFFFQIYINKDRAASEKLLKQAESCGIKGIMVTVDAPVTGKREADERVKADEAALAPVPMSGAAATNDAKGGGLGRTMGGYIDATLNWNDLKWLRKATKLPVILKGVQTAEDAIMAAEHGLDGIFVSNHGGRSLDTSTPAILVLLELQRRCPFVFDRLEVYMDGGIRRGTDIFKALCLGAKAVGMGRHFLYAANYGQEGVEHLFEIMKDELETTMRMVGVTSLSQLHPGLLNTLDVDYLLPGGAGMYPKAQARL
ncbi:hypothetical protein GQ53DRAFT_863875 [Thozetella sp. PMI_491]|nr:hypothetical protein GQ53DRAFT_863875 [Thozetella sp. PMI_491]